MNKKQIFQRIIADFINRPLGGVKPRNIDLPLDVPKIVSLLGPRRAGKTYVLFHLIRQLRETVAANRLVYINLEDDRLFPLQLGDMDGLLQGYYEMFPENREQQVWFFLDEVQEVEHWEKFVRRLSEQENCRVYLTGSSSKLLSRELATSLRGRTLPYEVFPLSYQEFLAFHAIDIQPHASQGQALALHWLARYMRQGGFPELVFLPEDLHRSTINEYIDLMLYRDLTERFSLKNPALLKYLLKFTLLNISNPLSGSKLFNDLKSQGYAVSKNTVYEYLSHLEEAFILYRAPIWSHSIRVQAIRPEKVYTVDSAFKYAMTIGEDTGRVFENLLYMALRRKGIAPCYWLDGQEVDFYWENGQLINACYDLSSPGTKSRELSGLQKAMDQLGIREAQLITWDEEGEWISGNRVVHILPLWKFLL